MPKWVKQIVFSFIMLIVMIAALYTSGKEAGTQELLYDFLILITAMVYIVSVFCVSYDAEIRGVSVFWISMLCCFLPIITHTVWFIFRPEVKYSFEEYLMDDEFELDEESEHENSS